MSWEMVVLVPVVGDLPSVNDVPTTVKAKITRSKLKQSWRDATTYSARSMLVLWKRSGKPVPLPPCNVQVELPFPVNRRRDPHNYVGTVVKWVVDGLVKAGMWPDDNPEYVTVLEPILVVTKRPDTVRVRLTPREEPTP